jgi:hypothetical protein
VTEASRRQLVMLGALLIVLGGVTWYRLGDTPASAPVSASNPAQVATAPAGSEVPVVDVRLELLKPPGDELGDAERNPFRFQTRPEPVAPRPVAPPRPAVVVPPAPTGPPPPPPIALKFIGVLDAPARIGRVAILSDSRGNVFYGKEGDIIDGRYQVLKIGTESAELAYSDGRGRQTLRLSGQ